MLVHHEHKNGDCLMTVNHRTTLRDEDTPNIDKCKDRVNTLLLVLTVVATVTFVAGFTIATGSLLYVEERRRNF